MNQIPLRVLVEASQALRGVMDVPYSGGVRPIPPEVSQQVAKVVGALEHYVEEMLKQKVGVES